jgi:hypothetical protein
LEEVCELTSPVDKQFGYAHSETEEGAATWVLHNCGQIKFSYCT